MIIGWLFIIVAIIWFCVASLRQGFRENPPPPKPKKIVIKRPSEREIYEKAGIEWKPVSGLRNWLAFLACVGVPVGIFLLLTH